MLAFLLLGLLSLTSIPTPAQAALLMEEPFGLFGTINPTGHNAIYLEDVCAADADQTAPLQSW